MHMQSMDIVAERTLKFLKKGETEECMVMVRIGRPEPSEGHGWAAPYQIVCPWEEVRTRHVYGVDSMMALLFAIYIVPSHLRIIAGQGTLLWDDSDNLGFLPPIGSSDDAPACPVNLGQK
jgi:hypothetical protein